MFKVSTTNFHTSRKSFLEAQYGLWSAWDHVITWLFPFASYIGCRLLRVLTTNFAFWYTSRLLAKYLITLPNCWHLRQAILHGHHWDHQAAATLSFGEIGERSATGRLLLLPPASGIVCPPNLRLCDPRLLLSDISRPICFLPFMKCLKHDNLTV